MYRYDEQEKKLEIKRNVFNFSKEEFTLVSRPIEYKGMLYFIHPFEWECKGEIIKYNLDKKIIEKKLDIEEENMTIKDIFLSQDNQIYLLIGFLSGTVSIGGNLYKCDLELNNLKLIREFDENIQVTQIIKETDKGLKLKGLEYVDLDFIDSEEIEFEVEK